jgi:S-adenosylmethionine hydrolase
MTGPLVSLTTDFGLADPSVAICKGVILSIAPDARIVDVSHGIARQSVGQGAAILSAAVPYLPVGVHLAVVDPGVGTSRRPIALRCGRGDFLVGPDNGLLVAAAEALGGATACHELANAAYRLSPLSRTFHGRDIFSPAAAHLAAGVSIAGLGPAVAPAELVRLDLPPARVEDGTLAAIVVSVDAFGNAQLLAAQADLEHAVGEVRPGDRLAIATDRRAETVAVTWARAYGEAAAGEPVVLVDAYGRIAVAINRGDAATVMGLLAGDWIRIARADRPT